MKKIALPLLAVAGLFAAVPTMANATPNAALLSPMLALPRVPTQSIPISCETKLGDLVEKLQAPGIANRLDADSTLIWGDVAYAESCGGSGPGFCETSGEASKSGSDVVGISKVGLPGQTDRTNLAFRLTLVDGKAKIKWSFKGKNYIGSVKACNNGYWTATSATSAFAVKLAGPYPVPE